LEVKYVVSYSRSVEAGSYSHIGVVSDRRAVRVDSLQEQVIGPLDIEF
jgi:hypothetical protein